MSQNRQTKLSCLARAAAATAFFALHSAALHTAAYAQVQPAHFVAPQIPSDVIPVAAPSATPAAVPAVASGTRPVTSSNLIKQAVMPAPASSTAARPIACGAPASEFKQIAGQRPTPHVL